MIGLLLLSGLALAQPVAPGVGACAAAVPGAPAQFTVLTTSPGPSLFTAFGHAALRASGGERAAGVVFDWGHYEGAGMEPVFDFLGGDLAYTMQAVGERRIRSSASRGDRSLVAQVLQLPPDAAARLQAELAAAEHVEDSSFRYHWLWDNCSTRVRDALDQATGGALRQELSGAALTTPRAEVLRHLASPHQRGRWWWAWAGWHAMASDYADQPLDAWQATFMPDRLQLALDQVELTWPDGQRRPLVVERCTLRRGSLDFPPLQPPRPELPLLGLGLGLAGLVGLGATRARLLGGLVLGVVGLVAGGLGLVTMLLALTSVLEGLSGNQNWWVASPASLLLLGPAVALARGRAGHRSRAVVLVLAALGLLGLGLLLLGLSDQDALAVYAVFLPPLLAAAAVLLTRRGPHG